MVLRRVREMEKVRAVVVRGEGSRAFCAGSDMREFEELSKVGPQEKLLHENDALRQLHRLPAATIAAIEGAALGGGLELALACDLRVVGEGARLALPECRVGGLASAGSQWLVRLVGAGVAKEMLFLGEPIDLQVARNVGLVTRIVPTGEAASAAKLIAEEVARRAPLSIRLAKQLVDRGSELAVDAALAAGLDAQELVFASHDLQEGAQAFFSRRTPDFKGL